MATVNPSDFIITRKRKKYRFAKFANAENCFEYDEWLAFMQQHTLQNITLEVGAGTGLFSLELARRYPENTYVALDVKGDRLQNGAYEAIEQSITNVYFVRARADQLAELFSESSLIAIWLTFPDPFPRKRSEGRRMTHPNFLAHYKKALLPKGALYLKHDNRDFFHWSLEQLVREEWRIDELSFDLHDSSLGDDYKVLTTYERRWLSEGLTTNFVKATYTSR